MLSTLPALLISTRVLYHVFDNMLHRTRILESLATETHLQTHHVAPAPQLFPLYPDFVDLGYLGPVPDDLGPQRTIPHAMERVAHMLGRWEIRLQHPHCFVGEGLNLLGSRVGRRVQLAPVVRAIGGEVGYHVQVTSHVDLDVPGWHRASKLVGNGEGYRLVPLVDLKVLRDEDRRQLPVLLVTFELNARLDLSGKATTKSLSSLGTELVLQVLSERTRVVRVRMIRGDEGVGDIPGVRGDSGGVCRFCAKMLD